MGNLCDCMNSYGWEDSLLVPLAVKQEQNTNYMNMMNFSARNHSNSGHVVGTGTVQFPIHPIGIKEQTGLCSMKRAMENYQAGNYLATMRICRAYLANNESDYEAQLLLGQALASYKMLKCAEESFRAAIKLNQRDHRGWKGLSGVLEASNQKTSDLLEIYLTILTFAKPKTMQEWNQVCDKALGLHTELGGKTAMNMKLRHIKSFMIGYPNFDDAVMGKWQDLIYSFPTKHTPADEIIMKAACRMVKDCPQSTKLDQMKCDILLAMTCKDRWPEVEAKCLLTHKLFPSEILPMKVLARQYIKTDMGCIQDRMIKIYQDLHKTDNQSPHAAIGFGQTLLSHGNYQSAITWLKKGVAYEKQNVHGWLYLAKAYIAVKDLTEAYKASLKGLEVLKDKPNSASTRSIRSQLELCRSQSAVESNDNIAAIAALVEMIPPQSPNNQTPTDLYLKLAQACKRLHNQREPFRQAGAESLQDWRRGKRADYQLQHAIKYWQNGMETRTDPWMFLDSILKALKQDPWNADVFLFLGRYMWEIRADLRLAKEFFELAYKLRLDSESGAYLVDVCMVLQEMHTALQILTGHLSSSPNAKWVWLRLGLLQMGAHDYNLAETSFWTAINADSISDRQPYECLARTRLRRFLEFDARKAFATGAKLQNQCLGLFIPQMSDKDVLALEATDLRAMYSDTIQWTANPQAIGVQFAFSILYAICPDLLKPVGFDFSRIIQARKDITNVYSGGGLCHTGKRTDWRQPDKQCAYMLRFFLIHCQFVPWLLRSTPNILSKFPTGNHLRVCCVGGGPGSDIIGLLTFLRSINRSSRLTCHVLDKFPAWENVWKTIQPRLPPPSVNASYLSLDITSTNPLDRQIVEAISQADIITFVKSVSPTVAFLKAAPLFQMQQYPAMPVQSQRGAIPTILRTLKSGALVIYIDNRHGDQNPIFHKMAVSEGLRVVHKSIWMCDITANKSEYDAVWNGYSCKPCSSCSLQGYVFYKP